MSYDFSDLDPKGKTAVYVFHQLRDKPSIESYHAGSSNRAFVNAVAKAASKAGSAARRIQSGNADADALEESRDQDRELYPLHVCKRFEKLPMRSDGTPAANTREELAGFLRALPDWIFDEYRLWAQAARNFLPDDLPTPTEVDAQAGK